MLNKLILIGASKGIGRKFLETYSSTATEILAIGSSDKIYELEQVSKNIEIIKVDISNIELFESEFKKWMSTKSWNPTQKIGLVCFASIIGNPGGIDKFDHQSYQSLFNCNLFSHLSIISLLKKKIDKSNSFRVIMLAGGGAAYGYPDFFSYSLSKVAVIRAVENIGLQFVRENLDASIIALAPGAVDTDMLKKVIANGGYVKTKTDIKEPITFINKFLLDILDSLSLNGRFIHVRDNLDRSLKSNQDLFMLRRIE
jgi:short-subunit dehydrogenase